MEWVRVPSWFQMYHQMVWMNSSISSDEEMQLFLVSAITCAEWYTLQRWDMISESSDWAAIKMCHSKHVAWKLSYLLKSFVASVVWAVWSCGYQMKALKHPFITLKRGSLILQPLRLFSMRSQWEFGYHISSNYFFSSVIIALLDVTSRKKG